MEKSLELSFNSHSDFWNNLIIIRLWILQIAANGLQPNDRNIRNDRIFWTERSWMITIDDRLTFSTKFVNFSVFSEVVEKTKWDFNKIQKYFTNLNSNSIFMDFEETFHTVQHDIFDVIHIKHFRFNIEYSHYHHFYIVDDGFKQWREWLNKSVLISQIFIRNLRKFSF